MTIFMDDLHLPTPKLGAMWEKKDKNGNIYYSGKWGRTGIPFMAFRNKHKNKDTDPDWLLMTPNSNQTTTKEVSQDATKK